MIIAQLLRLNITIFMESGEENFFNDDPKKSIILLSNWMLKEIFSISSWYSCEVMYKKKIFSIICVLHIYQQKQLFHCEGWRTEGCSFKYRTNWNTHLYCTQNEWN